MFLLFVLGHVMRTNDGNVLRKALTSKIEGLKKKGRPEVEWRNKIASENSKVGSKEKEASGRKK